MLLWGRRCPQSTDPSQYEIGSKGKEQACSHLGITLEPSSMSLFFQCSRHQLLGALSPPFPDEPEEKVSSVLLEIRPEGQMTLEINLQTDDPARGWNLCRAKGEGGQTGQRWLALVSRDKQAGFWTAWGSEKVAGQRSTPAYTSSPTATPEQIKMPG